MKRYTREQRRDEHILASIIAAANVLPRKVIPHNTHDGVAGSLAGFVSSYPDGPCCAVGAGALYKGMDPRINNAIEYFAAKYGVSRAYAEGVSSGFENREHELNYYYAYRSPAFWRGLQVGRAAFEALHLS